MPDNILACNIGSFGKYRANAYAHLQQIGLTNVEIPVPKPEELEATQQALASYGLRATTLTVPCDASTDEGVEAFVEHLAQVKAMHVHTVFVSVKQGEAPLPECYMRLRRMGDAAATHGVTIAVETHPPFAHNAAAALETVREVGHPNVRLNYDTGNIYYYNENADGIGELEQIADCVAAVHLKDTGGGFKAWDFPTLGQGVCDFPAIFQLLNQRGFYGPFTMELEGIEGENFNEEQHVQRIADSVAFLRSKGLVP